jgi:lipid II:glycine glycyltransferase (peptidoglycan interpeptide bridge formation enzyme)
MIFIKNITETSLEACDGAASFLQSPLLGEFKSRFDWTAKAFLIDWGGESRPLLVLIHRLVKGYSFAYVPWGPELPETILECCRNQALVELAKELKRLLARNTVFVRFDPPWYTEGGQYGEQAAPVVDSGFKRAAANVQPPDTVIVDLAPSCEEILASMKSKWRYNISLAGKKGVQVSAGGVEKVEIFYKLLTETAARDGIAVHSFDYYKTLVELCEEKGKTEKIRIYVATHDGAAQAAEGSLNCRDSGSVLSNSLSSPTEGRHTLAAIVVLARPPYATYLYGASSNVKRNLMAPYALQWQAMRDAKEAGCLYYDLFGIPPDDNPNHPMAGLYLFKTGFGGKIIHRPGSWDYRYKRLVYALFNMAEGLRKKMRDRKKKR